MARDSVVLMALTLLGSLLSFGFQWLMARMLEPGQYATAFSLLGLMAILAVPSQVVSLVSIRIASAEFVVGGRRRILRGALRGSAVAASAGLVIWAAVALASGALAEFLNTSERAGVILVGGAATTVVVVPIMKGVLTGARAFVALGLTGLVDGIARVGFGAVLVALGAGVAGAVAATPLSGLVGYALATTVVWWLFGRLPDRTERARRVPLDWAANLRVALIGLSVALFINVDVLLVRHFFGDADAALYAASALIGRVVLFASLPAASVMLPHLVRHVSAGEPFGRTFLVGAALMSTINVTAALVIVTRPEFAFGLVFGDRYVPVVELVWAYVLAGALLGGMALLSHLHIGVGRLNIWLIMLPMAFAYAVVIFFGHDSLLQVVWTLNAFLGATFLMQIVSTVTLFRKAAAPPRQGNGAIGSGAPESV